MNGDYSSEETKDSVTIKSQSIEATEVVHRKEDGNIVSNKTRKSRLMKNEITPCIATRKIQGCSHILNLLHRAFQI